MGITLIGRDSKQKVRVVQISWKLNEDLTYSIHRSSGLLDGKQVAAPEIIITTGKVKRTAEEQCILQFNSEVKKYLDKGYKNVNDFGIEDLTIEAAESVLPKTKTDSNDIPKPMLCKVIDWNKPEKYNQLWKLSYKLDGVRCILYYKDGIVRTASRGGQNYDIPATYIRNDASIKKLFEQNPNLKLDGEIYKHGWTLAKISGLCRKEQLEEDHTKLSFYCYDIVDEDLTAIERINKLNDIKTQIDEDSKLVIVKHFDVHNLDEIRALHDEAVSCGYEGAVIRDPNSKYKCGGRTSIMQKAKLFQDDEFKILGLVEGLREEDMCFLMETKEGYQFKAKPIGDRALKQWYRNNINDIIGKIGTVKFFGYTNTEHPVPNLPTFRCIRDEKDI